MWALNSWLTTNMIKLFQSKKEQDLANLPELKSGSVFGVEVDFESKEYPILSLISHPFDFSQWERVHSASDHWISRGQAPIFSLLNDHKVEEKIKEFSQFRNFPY